MVFCNTRLLLGSFIWASVLICLSSGLPSQESFLGSNLDKFPSDEKQVLGLFQLWRNYHGKIYTNSEEGEHRYQIFQRNLKHITETNAKRSSNSLSDYRLGLNKFADMSSEEFRDIYLHQIETPAAAAAAVSTNTIQKKSSCAAPRTMDWRKKGVVTPVKNQNQCASCWAFAATGAMESINAIKTGKLISVSEQELIDCDHISQGCAYGWSFRAFEWVIRNGGISKESDYPYQSKNGTCKSKQHNGHRDVKINGYTKVAPTENALLCATAKQPITVSLNATDFQFYHRGIYDGHNCPKDSTNTNHIALIVGYDSKHGKDYWILKNSWGDDWGMNGYIFIQRNTKLPYGVCSINAWAYHPNKN